MAEEDRWAKLERIVEQAVDKVCRKVIREELASLQKPTKSRVTLKNGRWVGLGEIELTALRAAYPKVEVDKELQEMVAWIFLNPDDAPVSNYGAFINKWLKKHQDQASIRAISRPAPTAIQQKSCAYCPKRSIGNVSGYDYCDEHSRDAMDGIRPMGAVKRG